MNMTTTRRSPVLADNGSPQIHATAMYIIITAATPYIVITSAAATELTILSIFFIFFALMRLTFGEAATSGL